MCMGSGDVIYWLEDFTLIQKVMCTLCLKMIPLLICLINALFYEFLCTKLSAPPVNIHSFNLNVEISLFIQVTKGSLFCSLYYVAILKCCMNVWESVKKL